MTALAAPELTAEWQALALRLAGRYRCRAFSREDLQQEALLACLVALRSYDPGRHYPELRRYLYFRIRDHLWQLVTRAPDSRHLAADPLDPAPGPDENALRADVIDRAAAVLPPRRAAVLIGSLCGRDDRDMAAALGCTENLVRQERCLARSRLRHEFT